MHLPTLISDLAMILGVAAVVTFLFQKIRQPVVLGYIVAGTIVGPYTPTGLNVSDLPNIKVWAELGVIFLMFSLGLEFTFHKLARVGRAAVGTSVVESVLMIALGFVTGQLLGWKLIDCVFLGGILAISSTTIIIKAFDELGLRTRRFAELVFGVLIVEDLIAILLLVALSTMAVTNQFFSVELLYAAGKLVFIVGSWFVVGYFVIPTFLRYVGKSMANEALTILSTALCLLLVLVATKFHYSAALGAFMMGSILAETREAHRIESLINPLKDLFAAVFFVSVGMLVDPKVLITNLGPLLLITVVTIVGKILSSALGALLTGQPLKRSLQIGFSLAQIGEFSFIIATLGTALGVTSDFLYPIAVSVSVITTFTTPYLVKISEPFAVWLEAKLPARWTHAIARYVARMERPVDEAGAAPKLARRFVRFGLNGIVVALVFIAFAGYGYGWLRVQFADSRALRIGSWVASILIAAPFLWGMLFAFSRRRERPKGAALSLLDRSYEWFETHFLSNLSGDAKSDPELSALAPWDLHLTRLPVHANSALAGRPLKESRVRSVFGLNVAALQRGESVIVAPGPDDVIFPGDQLLVLGTDPEIDRFRAVVETPKDKAADGRTLAEYSLDRVVVSETSPLVGRTLRDSGLREKGRGLVVGLERGKLRTTNPDPTLTLEKDDVLWVLRD